MPARRSDAMRDESCLFPNFMPYRQRQVHSRHYATILAILSAQRKSHTDQEKATDQEYLTDVLNALHIAGLCVIQCGTLDAIKHSVDEVYAQKKGLLPLVPLKSKGKGA
jgi:hypothetical protein